MVVGGWLAVVMGGFVVMRMAARFLGCWQGESWLREREGEDVVS